ncbi:MAG: hypothetical protein ACPLKV_00005, partial [Minisyncoccia bacterium]
MENIMNEISNLSNLNFFPVTNLRIFLFCLSSSAFVLEIIFAIYFLRRYLKTGKTNNSYLYIALALFFYFLVRIPFVLSLIGVSFVIENLYLFFAITLPMYITALICIAVSLRIFCSQICRKRLNIFFHAWTIVAFIALGYFFISERGLFSNYE